MKFQTRKGFTLIELLIFMGIFSILVFILTDIFVNSLKTKATSESTAIVNQDSRFIFFKLMSDINNANTIVYPELGSSETSLTIVLYGQTETFQLNNGNLELVDSSGTHVLNSQKSIVANSLFTRLGNIDGKSSIKISLTVQSKELINNTPEIINLETTIGQR